MSLALKVRQYKLLYSSKTFPKEDPRPAFIDFFAGSGLVSYALAPYFKEVWANDICPKKASIFKANQANAPFDLGSIIDVNGNMLPACTLSWASFPCQDLSIAGNTKGIHAKRSGLVWEWIRVMDEMNPSPPLIAAENVVGLISANDGANYIALHNALVDRGYRIGALLLDAANWLPQSRPRIFIIAIKAHIIVNNNLISAYPTWAHSFALKKISSQVNNWVWWNIPKPPKREITLSQIVDFSIPCQDEFSSKKNLALISARHMQKLQECGLPVVPGYKRIRNKQQVLELRFDDIAGCLRTPSGGSSRQYLVIKQDDKWRTRLISPREAAKLMGAPDDFKLPGSFNDAYKAMGDAVAAPVAAYLAKHLLLPLAEVCNEQSSY